MVTAACCGALAPAAPADAAKPDLVVTKLGNPPGRIWVGTPAKVTVTVANRSRARAPRTTTRLYASFDPKRDGADLAVGRLSLPAGQRSKRARVSLRLPPATPLDSLELVACADAAGRVRERSERNNCTSSRGRFAALPPLTTLDLIQRAQDAGEITLDQAMLYKLRAVVGYPKPPERFRAANPTGGIDGVARGVVDEILGNWDDLSAATQGELDTFLRPPNYTGAALTDPEGETARRLPRGGTPAPSTCFADLGNPVPPQVNAADWDSIETEHFRFWHYTTDDLYPRPANHPLHHFNADPAGSLAAAQNLAAVAEHVYDVETAVFGREPLSDAGHPCNSGDAKIDVFAVRHLLPQAGAQVFPYAPGYAFRPGWMLVSPSFVADPKHARDVFAHEFAHLIQLAFDYAPLRTRNTDYGWLEEATANWAIDHLYPEDDFEHLFGRDYLWQYGFNNPINVKRGTFYGSAGQGHLNADNGYEDYLFFFYVARQLSPAFMSELWANTESMNSVQAVNDAVPGGFVERWPEFSRYNLNRDDLAHYKAWDGFDFGFKLDGTTQPHLNVTLGSGARRKHSWPFAQQTFLPQLSTKYASFDFADSAVRHVTFRDFGFNPEVREPDEHDRILAWWKLADGSTETADWTDGAEVSFCRDNADEDIRKLVVMYTNSRPIDYPEEQSTESSFPLLEGDTNRSRAAVIASRRCGWPGKISGRASGTVSYDGYTETFEVTFTTASTSQDQYVAYYGFEDSVGTLEWSISGSSDDCSLSGNATLDGVGGLSIYSDESLSTYGTSVTRAYLFDYVPVTQHCPPQDPEQISFLPLNCACPSAGDQPFTEFGTLQGSDEYTNEYDQHISWQWEIVPGSTPPPEAP